MNARILLTGFEPFDRDSINPSWEAVRALDGWRFELPGGPLVEVHARRMPCAFGAALQALDAAIDALQPQLGWPSARPAGAARSCPSAWPSTWTTAASATTRAASRSTSR